MTGANSFVQELKTITAQDSLQLQLPGMEGMGATLPQLPAPQIAPILSPMSLLQLSLPGISPVNPEQSTFLSKMLKDVWVAPIELASLDSKSTISDSAILNDTATQASDNTKLVSSVGYPLRDAQDVKAATEDYYRKHVRGSAEITGLGTKGKDGKWTLDIPQKGIFVFDDANSFALRKIGDEGIPLLLLGVNMDTRKLAMLALGGDFHERASGNISGSGTIISSDNITLSSPWEDYLTKRALKYYQQGQRAASSQEHIAKNHGIGLYR